MNDKEHRNLERAGKADTDRILTIPNVLFPAGAHSRDHRTVCKE